MILADKIIDLRKKNGWSQEELAEKLNVSRQSVSKWEGALSTPDLGRILDMAKLFGVTTDYLLKDELGDEQAEQNTAEEPVMRRVSLEEANEYLREQESAAGRIALGVWLCILSPVCLISLGGVAAAAQGLTETAAGAVGVVILLLMVAAAVAIFIGTGTRMSKWDYLEKEIFDTEYGISGMVRERRKAAKPAYVRSVAAGVALCILSPVPLILCSLTGVEALGAHMVSLLLAMVGFAVVLFIRTGVPWDAMKKLMQEEDYSPEKKRCAPVKETVGAVYWTVATAIYLAWSFLSGQWSSTWVLWPVAGVLFVAVDVAVEAFCKHRSPR